MEKLILEYIGEDRLGAPCYKAASGKLFKDINCGYGTPDIHTISGDDMDDDADNSISKIARYKDKEVVIVGRENFPSREEKFNYQLLDRLRSDCEYFLGNGNGHEPHLWATNVARQIEKMKELHNWFSEDKKPEWLTYEQILNYEKRMLDKLKE